VQLAIVEPALNQDRAASPHIGARAARIDQRAPSLIRNHEAIAVDFCDTPAHRDDAGAAGELRDCGGHGRRHFNGRAGQRHPSSAAGQSQHQKSAAERKPRAFAKSVPMKFHRSLPLLRLMCRRDIRVERHPG
jgi:hypothetical protein